jgi:hypothetical protein
MAEWRRRSIYAWMPDWVFYFLAVPVTGGFAFMAWFTFRNGIWAVVREPRDFYLLVICFMALVMIWRERPRKPKPPIKLNL